MSQSYKTSLQPKDLGSDLNCLRYIVKSMICNTVNTMLVVKVVAVDSTNGKVDVQTVIKDISNSRVKMDTFPIYSVRFVQWQSGANMVKMIPTVGDIGLLVVSKQDTSGLGNEEPICQTPERFNLSDGIYLGGVFGLNSTPTQTIEFTSNSINITGSSTVNITAPTVNLGGVNGKAIALNGDQVKSGSTVVGTIVASSTKVKAL